MGRVFTRRQAASSLLLAYAAIRMQRAAWKESVLHHAMGQKKDKRGQNNDEHELQESAQTRSPFLGVQRIPGRSHTNRLSGLRLQFQFALPLYIAPQGSKSRVIDPERLSAGIYLSFSAR
jgi:hypothetical protein